MASMLKIFALVAALAAVVLPQAAHAQVTTGQNGVCCAYINDPTTRTGWQLVCNKPALVRHHQPNGVGCNCSICPVAMHSAAAANTAFS
jgi:hypothetical protein